MIDGHFLRLYSDIAEPAAGAVACILVAGFAAWRDWRRLRRERLDAVGWLPWTAIFFIALFAACAFGLAALRAWAAG